MGGWGVATGRIYVPLPVSQEGWHRRTVRALVERGWGQADHQRAVISRVAHTGLTYEQGQQAVVFAGGQARIYGLHVDQGIPGDTSKNFVQQQHECKSF